MDLLRPFRRCCFCKHKDNLLRVSSFSEFFSVHCYYHLSCLQSVHNFSPAFTNKINVAIKITRLIEQDRRSLELKMSELESSRQRLNNTTLQGEVIGPHGRFVSSRGDDKLNALLELAIKKTEQSVLNLSDSEKEQLDKNKFKKIFKEDV